MSKSIYLAGPMTGIPLFNFPLFDSATKHLRQLGNNIVSPAELDSQKVRDAALVSKDGALDANGMVAGETWGDMLARDVKLIADACNGVCFLDGWERSRGARLEAFVGLLCKHRFYTYDAAGGLMDLDRFEVIRRIHNSFVLAPPLVNRT